MGNQASGFSVKYKYDSAKSIFKNAKKIQIMINKKIKNHEKGSYSFAKLMGYAEKTKDYSITNLTVADIPLKYGTYEIIGMLFAGPV